MSTVTHNQPIGDQRSQVKQARLTARSSATYLLDWYQWLPITVIACLVTLNFVGLLLVVRRFAGALLEPFPTGQMLFTALIATTLVAYSRNAWRRVRLSKDTESHHACYDNSNWIGWDRWVGWGSSIGLLLMAVGCAYPGEQLSDWLIWIPLLVADQFWRQSFFDGGKPAAPLFDDTLPQSEGFISISDSASKLATVGLTSDEDEQLLQQLFRVRNKAGQETIYGSLRADFKKGQRNVSLYVGFCPPLPHPPQVEAEPVDGPAATLKVVQALAHGARVDLRLDQPAKQDCHVLVDLAALDTG